MSVVPMPKVCSSPRRHKNIVKNVGGIKIILLGKLWRLTISD